MKNCFFTNQVIRRVKLSEGFKMNVIEIDNNGQLETYILHEYAKLSDCSILQKIGGSAILCSVCVDYDNPSEEEFLPLSVQYIEKMYAIGKIPQGFIKKESKPSEHEILTSRLIDRSLRPLFPKGFPYPVQITLLVMSYDGKTDVCKDSLNLASICLYLSSIPIHSTHILSAVRIVRYDEEVQICKSLADLAHSNLDLLVSGIDSGITMIEMQSLKTIKISSNDSCISESHITQDSCNKNDEQKMPYSYEEQSNEITEEKLLESIAFAHKHIQNLSLQYTKKFESFTKEKILFQRDSLLCDDLRHTLQTQYGDTIRAYVQELSKTERQSQLHRLIAKIAKEQNLEVSLVSRHVNAIKRDIVRTLILTQGLRPDGRTPTQIRDIHIESNLLPHVHGSACFTRGQTQALVTCTLGSQNDAQSQESIIMKNKKNVLFHYNFPPFSVGEAYPIGASSRREIGHGNLALKAIESNVARSPYTIRFVSEILQSNGSSSMASVCGATLALLGAGEKMYNMVAGIAIGLIYQDAKNFVVLSDITGLEDCDGDMDFKVAGTKKGFSALQLDIKITSLQEDILKISLQRAREGLSHILALMQEVAIQPNYELLPHAIEFAIPFGRMADIIGQGGKVIKDIIAKFNVNIDLNREHHSITLIGNNDNTLYAAKDYIFEILKKKERKELPYKIDSVYNGVVKKNLDFGVLVELPQGGEGLLRTIRLNQELEIGQTISVKIISNTNGKVELDMVVLQNNTTSYTNTDC